jgi:hypothetical protein
MIKVLIMSRRNKLDRLLLIFFQACKILTDKARSLPIKYDTVRLFALEGMA